MAETVIPFLAPSLRAFAQDLRPWVARSVAAPGVRRLDDVQIMVVRHLADSQSAPAAFAAAGIPWPAATGDTATACDAVHAARVHPGQVALIGPQGGAAMRSLLDALAPGRAGDAVAIDLSHGMLALALDGPRLDDWLARLVDASAIPRRPDRNARVRLADVPALLLRLADDSVWLIADRALAPYLADWLAFSHEGAFATTAWTTHPVSS